MICADVRSFRPLSCCELQQAPIGGAWGLYAMSKQANFRLAAEMQRRSAAAGSNIDATTVNPGFCATELQGKAVLNGGQPKVTA